MPRFKITIVTGDTDDQTFEDILRSVLRALTKYPAIAVRFGEYHPPDSNGAEP